MKIPKSVRIGYQKYEVTKEALVDNQDMFRKENENACSGKCKLYDDSNN